MSACVGSEHVFRSNTPLETKTINVVGFNKTLSLEEILLLNSAVVYLIQTHLTILHSSLI